MMRNILTLLAHDLAVAFKNKTLLLMVCIPFFVYGALLLVDRSDAPTTAVRIGLLTGEPYAPALRQGLATAPSAFLVREVANREEGARLLRERAVEGVLLGVAGEPRRATLLVTKRDSPATLALLQRFIALQGAVEGTGASWIAAVEPLQTDALALQALPTWILMVVLLVAFFVLPAQVAEEKEKQWLLGLLQTPLRTGEWLAAKLVYGAALMLAAVLALQLLARAPCAGWRYLSLLGAGAFCFGAMGIVLGLLCRSQASARTLGVICYLPLLVPAALSDASQSLRTISRGLPSYVFYEPVRSMLLDGAPSTNLPLDGLLLAIMGALACLLAHRLITVRWLM